MTTNKPKKLSRYTFEVLSNSHDLPTETLLLVRDDETDQTLFFAWSLDGSGAVYFDTADEVKDQLGLEV